MKKIQDSALLSAIVIIVLVLVIVFLPNIVQLFSVTDNQNSNDINNNNDNKNIISEELNKIKNDIIYRADKKVLTTEDMARKIYMISEKENKEIAQILKYDEWILAEDGMQLPLYEGYEINYDCKYYIALNAYDNERCTIMFASDKDYICTFFAPINVYNECSLYIDGLKPLQGTASDEVSLFYDIFASDAGFISLLDNDTEGISDDKMSAYAISKLEPYNMEEGNSIEEYNAITKRYFNKEISNFENSSTTIDKATGKIKSTGWSYDSSAYMLLKSAVDINSTAEQTAEFECYVISDVDLIDGKYKHVKEYLTTGNVEGFPAPIKLKLTFHLMRNSENGSFYIIYKNIEFIN